MSLQKILMLSGGSKPRVSGVYNFRRQFLANWYAAKVAVTSGASDQIVACLGDSTTAGGYSDGNQAGLWSSAYPAVLASKLNAAGIVSSGESFFGDLEISAYTTFAPHDPRITGSAGWAATTRVIGGKDWFNNSTTNPFAFTPITVFDKIDVFSLKSNAAFYVNFDGGANSLLTPGPGTVEIVKVTFTAASVGIHTVNAARISGATHLVGMIAYRSDQKRLNVLNLGGYGYRSADLAANTNGYDSIPSLKILAPKLTILQAGINDMLNAISVGTYTTNMQNIITAAKLSGDVLLVVPFNIASVSQATQDAFHAAVRNLGVVNNCVVLDMAARWGTFAQADSAGLMFGSNHATGAGYADWADALNRILVF